jgi:hypothetical protein
MKPYIDIATMTKSDAMKKEYIIAFINEFAQHFGLSDAQAYRYLKTYGAITNINKHYGALHKL